jgi:hypothetical protein
MTARVRLRFGEAGWYQAHVDGAQVGAVWSYWHEGEHVWTAYHDPTGTRLGNYPRRRDAVAALEALHDEQVTP